MTRILAVATNPASGASTRFRVLQWRPALEAAGFSLALDAFFSEAAARTIYRRGRGLAKLAYAVAGTARRWRSLTRARRTADVLLVHREAFPLGRGVVLGRLRRFPGPIVYDYDDAMFLPQRDGRGLLARLEDVTTANRIMAMSGLVLAGNRFLAEHARQHARRVVLLPTCVDTDTFAPSAPRPRSGPPVVGWIGSHSTAKYLATLVPVLETLAGRVPYALSIVGSGQRTAVEGVSVQERAWALDREVGDFARCDVGVYPLSNDPWVQGKCGFKAIQFMACGVPVVAADVGANRDIVEDGVNGFLAASPDEWVDKLERLLREPGLRDKLGRAARTTIEERYSTRTHAATLVAALRDLDISWR